MSAHFLKHSRTCQKTHAVRNPIKNVVFIKFTRLCCASSNADKERGRERVRKMEGGRTGVYAQVAQSSASNWGVWVNAKTYVKRQKRRRPRVEAFFVGFI